MRNKKIGIIIGASALVVVIAVAVFLLPNNNNNNENNNVPKHDCSIDGHVYGDTIIEEEATCQHEGIQYNECKYCGEKNYETIEITNHINTTERIINEPGCTKEGQKQIVCSDCNLVLSTESIPAKGHNYNGDICTVCGYNKNICAKGHKTSGWIIDWDSTCIQKGQQHKECVNCGEVLEKETISLKEHTPSQWKTDWDSTCTQEGQQHKECVNCGKILEKETISLKEHSSGQWIIDWDSTCVQEGQQHKECVNCKKILEKETISLKAHIPGQWVIDWDATCVKEGKKHQVCQICGKSLNEEPIGLKQHTFNGDICTVCGYYKGPCAKGHKSSGWIIDWDSTCTQEGQQHKECIVCGSVLETKAISLLEHISSDWIIDSKASCTKEGQQHKECTRCKTVLETQKINKTPHWYRDGGCIYCKENDPNYVASKGLYIRDGVLLGIGSCKDTDIKIPTNVTSIGYSAFYGCQSLTSITIPYSVTSINDYAFYHCGSLKTITFAEDNNVKNIGEFAFYECESLTSFVFHNNITNIGQYAFAGCRSLKISKNVIYVGCSDTLTKINEGTFQSCSSLRSFHIPETVTSIGYNAFFGCTSLESLDYDGTGAKWKNISKSSEWKGSRRIKINCTDGYFIE